jgi:hypothetical protein
MAEKSAGTDVGKMEGADMLVMNRGGEGKMLVVNGKKRENDSSIFGGRYQIASQFDSFIPLG